MDKTAKRLKTKGVLAVPYDKGTGFCLMKSESYHQKLDKILDGPQFKKIEANADFIIKEETKFCRRLLDLKKGGFISKEFYETVRPVGSQPARLYGLAKVHKSNVPVRPILSMPGSQYENLSKAVADILKRLPEAGIRTDKKEVLKTVQTTMLEDDEIMVSLDIESLFTNVPLTESINYTADLLYSTDNAPTGIDKATFKELLQMVSKDVVILTHRGYYRQVDGVAMGSSVGPLLANIFVSQFDADLGSFSKFYFRYVDDVIRTLRIGGENYLLDFVNTLHQNLKFTLETPDENNSIAFLDMNIVRNPNGNCHHNGTGKKLTLVYC